MFILPLVFMGIFGLLLGGDSATSLSFSVGVYDSPDIPELMSENLDLKEILTEISEESDTLDLEVSRFDDLSELKDKIKNDEIRVGVKLSEESNQPKFEVITGDTDLQDNIRASAIKEILTTIYFRGNPPITNTNIDTARQERKPFDLLAPGLIVYGMLILMPGIAQKWTEITEKKQDLRYSASKTSALELILGNFSFYLVIGLIQVAILYLTAQLFGYNPTGNLLLAFVPAVLTLCFVIFVGMLIGIWYKKTEPAGNIANILSIILGFLSGSFIVGIDSALRFELFGRTFAANDFVPTKWSTRALDSILTRNNSLMDIQQELLILGFSALAVMILTVVVYSRKKVKS